MATVKLYVQHLHMYDIITHSCVTDPHVLSSAIWRADFMFSCTITWSQTRLARSGRCLVNTRVCTISKSQTRLARSGRCLVNTCVHILVHLHVHAHVPQRPNNLGRSIGPDLDFCLCFQKAAWIGELEWITTQAFW